MAKLYDAIDERLAAFIAAQPLFFVATAPSGPDGHVNVSPKGGASTFRVTGPHGFAYVDFYGSGIETVAHLRENGRICVMFASFAGPPKIVRLHGRGRVVQQADEEFAALLAGFALEEAQRPAVRTIIAVDVTRVSDACGYVVPEMELKRERDQLFRHADNRIRKEGPDAIRAYITASNGASIDGLPGADPLVPG